MIKASRQIIVNDTPYASTCIASIGFTLPPPAPGSIGFETIASGDSPIAYSFAPHDRRTHCSRCTRTFATAAGCDAHERTYHGARYGKRA